MMSIDFSRSAIDFNDVRLCLFFFQAEDGIRDLTVTGVQTCALPILPGALTDPVVANLSRNVNGVTSSNFVLRITGSSSNIAASVTCRDGGGSSISCGADRKSVV